MTRTKTPQPPTPAEALLRAADIIEERGFTRGTFEDPETGAVCALGALNIATSIATSKDPRDFHASAAVREFFGGFVDANATLGRHCQAIVKWSDSRRSARVVADTMRKAARAWQREHRKR